MPEKRIFTKKEIAIFQNQKVTGRAASQKLGVSEGYVSTVRKAMREGTWENKPKERQPVVRQGPPSKWRIYTEEQIAIFKSDISAPVAEQMTGVNRWSITRIRQAMKRGDWKPYRPKVSEEIVEIIRKGYKNSTQKQLAEFTGLNISEVNYEILKLRQSGKLPPEKPNVKIDPFVVPKTGVLLAKTCLGCGLILSAKWFREFKTKGPWPGWRSPYCRACKSGRGKYDAEKYASSGMTSAHVMQRISLRTAKNNRKQWDRKEIATLKEKEKTIFQKSLELGRTYYATRTACGTFGIAETKADKALPDPTADQWIIKFPDALEQVQAHYRRLGPTAETEWEWNDDVA